MFGSQTRFFVLFALFVSVVVATDYVFTGDFNETRTKIPSATTAGKFYYLYSTDGNAKCRFRVNYNGIGVENLYQYLYDTKQQKSVLYSMCDVCTAESISEMPDKWWYDSNVYTKTSKKETIDGVEMYWYTRKSESASSMVSAILMNGATTPESTKVGAITFHDGRTFRITNFKRDTSLGASSSYFKTKTGVTCPTPTCSMFADIAFVLDYSGSVSKAEWTQTSNFVIGVMNSFAFGAQAAAAACIQFNAPSSYTAGKSRKVTCNYTKGTTTSRYYTDFTYPASACTEARTASVLAGADTSAGKTVSTNKNDLITVMSTSRTPSGNTCQGFGLELAMKVFDRSPRSSMSPKPERIVIAVTDGQDHCPNRTQAAAKKLREQYNAFFIGIGVGLSCDYDIEFITNLTSYIGSSTTRAYFDVTGYDKIKDVVDQIFSPLCEQFSSGCGPACKGFCGCGKCFCPTCNISSNKCQSTSCTARDGTSTGCVTTTKNCREGESTKCMTYSCDTSSGNCLAKETCEATRKQYPYTCQTVTCKLADGTCPVTFDDDFCKLKHQKDCELWRCAHAGEVPEDKVNGCVMVKNVTAECEGLKKKCLTVKCNTNTFSCDVVDNCKKKDTECEKFTCTGSGDSAYCKVTNVERPSSLKDDACTKYSCFPESGWKKNDTASLNAKKCRDMTPAEERTCKIFSCDTKKGCQSVEDSTCVGACKNIEEQCWSNVSTSLSACQFTKCVGEGTQVSCKYETNDCTTSDAAKEAERRNKDTTDGGCYTYECSYGSCEFMEVLPRRKSTKCVTWTCVGDITTGWNWEKSYTDAYVNCKNDSCYERRCDDDEGCVATEICESKSNKCYSYTCNENKTCDKEVLLKEYDCMKEECSEDGTIIEKWSDCSERPCMNWECSRTKDDPKFGVCVYANNTYPIPPDHEDYYCTIFTCNETDNTWIMSPKCVSDDACNPPTCTVDGQCGTEGIDCYDKINMTNYPCFRAACKQDPNDEKGYRCVRKLKSGAYIDICGRCIRESEIGSSVQQSSSEDAIACTEAPDEPMLKEGLAAASVAMIVLAAVIIGGALATSGIIGTKTLLERARAANNQSAHSNPLFEDNEAEMTNPTFAGEN